MLTAAGAASATGAREMLYAAAGWRVPLVLANASRALSAPITLEPDHKAVLAVRRPLLVSQRPGD